jgi:flagellar M-ring protein FliF
MNEWLKNFFAKLKELWSKWTVIQKGILAGIIVVVIIAIAVMAHVSSKPTTVPLFNTAISDQNARDQILMRLDEENVKATVSSSGMISVPDEKTARRMRAILVREDLVPTNVDPWALFDVTNYSETDFERNVNLQRSITNMITQHLEALDDVARANVVLGLPEDSLLAEDQKPITASVILYFKQGSDMATNRKKILGVQKLLIRAIPGLKDENVTIVDSEGNELNDFAGMADSDRVDLVAKEQKLIQKQEAEYRAKVLKALQQIFTSDRVRDLNLKIDMDMSKITSDATTYTPIIITAQDPDKPYDTTEKRDYLPISSQTVTKEWTGTGYNPEGPAGVEGQNPPVYSDMSNVVGKSTETGVTQNNVVNTTQTHKEQSPNIDRVTVSVNIDGTWQEKYDKNHNPVINAETGGLTREYVPVDTALLDQARQLVQNAVGYNKSRGDSVTVTNIPVDRSAEFLAKDLAYIHAQQTRRTILLVLAGTALVLLAFIIFRFVSREIERRKRLREEEILRRQQQQREQALWDAKEEGMEVTMSVEERKRAELQENAIAMAKEHPEDVAMLIRTWLMEE